MLKIAFISTMAGFPWGGSEFLWAATAEQALIEGHNVFISLYDWSVDHPSVSRLQHQNACLFPRPRFPQPISLTKRIVRKVRKYLPRIPFLTEKSAYQAIFDSKPDIICISQGSSYDIAYIPELHQLLKESSIPYLIICHFNSDTYFPEYHTRSIVKEVFANAARVAFVSQHNLKLAERQLAQALPDAVVVQNPVNMHELSAIPYPNQSKVYFAVVARLDTAYKGHDILLETLSLPDWKTKNWQCNLYGSGPDKDYIEALVTYYNLDDKVKVIGHVADVRSIWAENHLLILPSRGEGTPLSLIEAMLCGRPAVVTNVGGNADWIEDSKTGFVAEAPTVNLLNNALDRAWITQHRWKEMGLRAHEDAISRFDPSPGRSLLKLILDAIEV